MIRTYILHVEFHWGYWPKISIKRKPRHGQYAVDGGFPGRLKLCPECQDGFLFEQDPFSKKLSDHASPVALDFNAPINESESPETLRLDIKKSPSTYRVGNKLWTRRAEYVITQVVPGDFMILTRLDILNERDAMEDYPIDYS